MTENYFIDVLYNEKVILTTMLFDSEIEAVNWWEMVGSVDKYTKAYLLKETLNHNNFKTNTEIVRELK